MPLLATLYRDGDCDAYRGELARMAGRPLFFLHIPKTAGSSITYELHVSAARYRNVHVPPERAHGADHRTQFRDLLGEIAANLGESDVTAYSGHAQMRDLIETGWPLGGVKLVTLLRDPIERTISDYLYQRSPRHPPSERFREQFPTMKDFVLAPHTQDKCARFLGAHPLDPADKVIEHVLDSFLFVGLVERYPLSVRMITRLAGNTREPTAHKRVTSREGFTLDDETRALILERNTRDIALYDFFSRRFDAHQADFEAILREDSGRA